MPRISRRREVAPLAYNVEEAAEALSMSPESVRKLVRDGLLPTIIGVDRIIIPVKAIEAYLDRAEYRGRGGDDG